METNEILRKQIFEIIKNQMKDNEPPETNKTFNDIQNSLRSCRRDEW